MTSISTVLVDILEASCETVVSCKIITLLHIGVGDGAWEDTGRTRQSN